MQVQIQWVFIAVCRVVEPLVLFINFNDSVNRVGRAGSQIANLVSTDVSQFELLPTSSLSLPDKMLAIVQKLHQRRILLPGLLLLGNDDTCLSSLDVCGHHIHFVLPTIGAMKNQFLATWRKFNVVNVLINWPFDIYLNRLL